MRYLIALLALAGILDSYLALRIHNQDASIAPPCAVTEKWDCGTVNHSRYSVFPPETLFEEPGSKSIHIPVAALGIAGYVLIAVLALANRIKLALLTGIMGLGFALYLSYLEARVIEKWCIYCVWSQVIVGAIVVASILTLALQSRNRTRTLAAAVS